MKSRKIPTLILIVLLYSVFLMMSIGQGQNTGSAQVHSTGFVKVANCSYTVWKDGIYTVLSNSAGTEITRNTDAITIINQAITLANTISGSVLIMNGTYTLTKNINMKSNVIVALQLGVTMTSTYAPTSRTGIVTFNGITNAHFITETEIGSPDVQPTPAEEAQYPKITGIGTADAECGVLFAGGSTYCSVGQIQFNDPGGFGISVYYAHNNTVDRTYVYGFCKAGGGSHQGLDLRAATYNTFNHVHIDAKLNAVDLPNEKCANSPMYFGGDQGDVAYNQIIGGIFENSPLTHAIYWCNDEAGFSVHDNYAWGGISRHCHGTHPYATGFKLNPACNNHIGVRPDGTIDPWLVYDCWDGLALHDNGAVGNYGNVIYMTIKNCKRGADVGAYREGKNVQYNEVHLDIDGNDPNYEKVPSSCGYGLCFFRAGTNTVTSHTQYNTFYVRVRNTQISGILFTGWNGMLIESMQPIYNTIYCDIETTGYPIYWTLESGGWGTYNTFTLNHMVGQTGNCANATGYPPIPNAEYVYTDDLSFIPNIAMNTFSLG